MTATTTQPGLFDDMRDRAKQGPAWSRFNQMYGPAIHRQLARWGLQEADIEDVRQEVLLAVFSVMPGFRYDPSESFRGYLYQVVRSKYLTHIRRPANRAKARGGTSTAQFLAAQPDTRGSSRDAEARLRQALPEQEVPLDEELWKQDCSKAVLTWAVKRVRVRSEMHDRSFEIYVRTTINGEAVAEVAASLGESPGAVHVARSRVKKLVKAELEHFVD